MAERVTKVLLANPHLSHLGTSATSTYSYPIENAKCLGSEDTVRNLLSITILVCASAMFATAQTPSAGAKPTTVVRTTKAMHYRAPGSSVKIAFQGTEAMSSATGEAKVEGKKTNIEIDAKFQGLDDTTKFGLEYLTYVLVGRLSAGARRESRRTGNTRSGKGRLKTYTDMQTFGMIVTAEPYSAVSQPGNTVILEMCSGKAPGARKLRPSTSC